MPGAPGGGHHAPAAGRYAACRTDAGFRRDRKSARRSARARRASPDHYRRTLSNAASCGPGCAAPGSSGRGCVPQRDVGVQVSKTVRVGLNPNALGEHLFDLAAQTLVRFRVVRASAGEEVVRYAFHQPRPVVVDVECDPCRRLLREARLDADIVLHLIGRNGDGHPVFGPALRRGNCA